jgi:hypothetical protein
MFRRPGGDLDVMQVQRVLEKNAELELVVSLPILRKKQADRLGMVDVIQPRGASCVYYRPNLTSH